MSAFQKEAVLSVKHWTDSLFSFTEGSPATSWSRKPLSKDDGRACLFVVQRTGFDCG
jgi:hypothetical protein